MNEDAREAILAAVDAELEGQVELLAEFLRDDADPSTVGDASTTYAALTVALALMPESALIDLAFAGIVRAAKVKLAAEDAAADAAVNDSADV